MAAAFSISRRYMSAINFCVILFILLCPLRLSASQEPIVLSSKCLHVSTTSQEAIDLSSKCPHVLTTANIKNKPSNDGSLLVVVPWKMGFEQFVSFNPDSCSFDGFSVRVFLEAVHRMRPSPPRFDFVLHGNGSVSPSYDSMIDMVARGEADAVVADLTITSERMEKVGFSMPFLPSSLVMVTTLRYNSEGMLWDFLKPFSMPLWVTLLVCFVATGFALYLLENQNRDFSITVPQCKKHHDADSSSHDTSTVAHTPPCDVQLTNVLTPSRDPSSLQPLKPSIFEASHKHRIMNAYWFTSLSVFAAQEESVRTHLGRIVTVMWLFTMLIFNSSYTASLASLLSAQKRNPAIERFQDLLQDNNISVGYQEGSFMTHYMQKLHIEHPRLKNFTTERDYAEALRKGNLNRHGVGAVLDELPYIQILLHSQCDLTKISDDDSLPAFGGFGFAFHKNSSLIKDVSKMILAMKEDGMLQVLKSRCGIYGGENSSRCTSSDEESSQLRLRSFGGLFSILAGVYLSCILIRLLAKKIQEKEGICSPITNAFAMCSRWFSCWPRRAIKKVNDVSLEQDT